MSIELFVEFEDGKPEEFQGDVVCPMGECNTEGSDVYILNHWVHCHRVRDKKDRLLGFLDNDEYLEWSTHDRNMLAGGFERTNQHIESGIEAHPILSIEMYESYFGSVDNAEELTSIQSRTHQDYNPDNPFPERRAYLLMKENIQSRTHKVYGTNWGEISWDIYERDDFECRICGDNPSPRSGLDVHHITPAREFDDQSAMNDPSNLITLCNSCHGQHEGKHAQCNHDEFVRRIRSEQRASTPPTSDGPSVDVLDRIPHLEANYQVCLLALAVLEHRGDTPARTSEVYSEYKRIAELVDIDPLTERTVRKKLNDLDTCNLTVVHTQSGDLQGGQYYVAELAPSIESLLSGFEHVDRFDEITQNLSKFNQQSILTQ